MEFHVNGVFPNDGYHVKLLEDGTLAMWQRIINRRCFANEHLHGIMRGDYYINHHHIVVYDGVGYGMVWEKVSPTMATWGAHLRWHTSRLRASVQANLHPVRPSTHYSIVSSQGTGRTANTTTISSRVQLADQRTITMAAVKKQYVNILFDIQSSCVSSIVLLSPPSSDEECQCLPHLCHGFCFNYIA